jgi:hypothetical protein
MSKKVAAKKMGAKSKAAKPNHDAKVYALRNSDPEKWTWVKLDLHFWKKETHGGNSFSAYKREVARLKVVRGQSSSAAKVAASRVNAKKAN